MKSRQRSMTRKTLEQLVIKGVIVALNSLRAGVVKAAKALSGWTLGRMMKENSSNQFPKKKKPLTLRMPAPMCTWRTRKERKYLVELPRGLGSSSPSTSTYAFARPCARSTAIITSTPLGSSVSFGLWTPTCETWKFDSNTFERISRNCAVKKG